MEICGYKARFAVENDKTCTVFVENEETGYSGMHNHPSLDAALADNENRVSRMIAAAARGEA